MNLNLNQLHLELQKCQKCIQHDSRLNLVPGEGNPNAKIMIVGEAPNKEEDAYGMPFIGNVGFVLNSILTDSGIYRDDVYITHAVKCRSNKRITHNDVDMCRFNLKTQQIILNPTVIITLGSIALYAITRQRSISKLRGKFIILPNGIHVMPTLHPTNLIRSSNYELYDKVVKDFIKAKSLF